MKFCSFFLYLSVLFGFCSTDNSMKPLTYSEVNQELDTPGTVLIDVRNPDELKSDGKIKQAKNIPLGELPNALKMTDEVFKQKFGFDKPKPHDHVIVHCKSGKRAQDGAKDFVDAGYADVKVYPGILDWKSNGGSVD